MASRNLELSGADYENIFAALTGKNPASRTSNQAKTKAADSAQQHATRRLPGDEKSNNGTLATSSKSARANEEPEPSRAPLRGRRCLFWFNFARPPAGALLKAKSMIFLRPRICLWVCLSLLTILSRGDGLSAQAETPHGSSNVKVTRHPNMDAPGDDATWVRGITSVEQCESMCLANGACAGYTYNIKQSACFQKSAIGPLAPSSVPTITGVVDRQSGGLAAQNRAITIVGKPSFDCRKAKSETAQAICGSTRLIQLDLQLAKLFWAKMAKLSGSSAEEEKRRQLDWGVGRNQCSADAACVEQSYQRRIAELGGQALASTAPPSQTPPPPVQQVAEQKPQLEMEPERKEFRTSVQQLPNPIRLIGQADQPCDVASATLARLRKTLSVSVPDGLTVQAEDLRSFMWKTSGAQPLGPAYLVLAADAPVRVQGTGSYVLTPDAKAPFRIKQFLQQTRVIIPLHVKVPRKAARSKSGR